MLSLVRRGGIFGLGNSTSTSTSTAAWAACAALSHAAVPLRTKYRPYDDQYHLKQRMFNPIKRSSVDAFLRELGFTENGVIGPELKTYEIDEFSRLEQFDKRVPLQPSYVNLKATKTCFLKVDKRDLQKVLDGAKDYVFPEAEGLDYDLESPQAKVISKNKDLGSKRFDFVFVDTSKGYEHHTRPIFVREKSGSLRTASPDEREVYNYEFFADEGKRSSCPALCTEDGIRLAIDKFMHKDVLDNAVEFLYPYQKDYKRAHVTIYEDVLDNNRYHALQDSQHWSAFVRWLKKTNKLSELVRVLKIGGRFTDAAKVARYAQTGDIDIPSEKKAQQQYVEDFLKMHRANKRRK